MNAPKPIGPDFIGGQNKPFGSVERTIARRYLGAKKSEGGVAAIAWISFICIALAIIAMITIMSIMNGFRAKLLELTIGSQGHMYVLSSTPNPTPESIQQMEARLAGIDGVDEAFEFTENIVGVNANGQISIGHVLGIRPDNLDNFELITQSIEQGSLQNFGQGRGADHQVSIGAFMAAELGLSLGDKIKIYTGRTRKTITGETPIIKDYTIGSIFKTGLYTTDLSTIYMDYDQAVLLFENGKPPGTIQLRLEDPDRIEALYGAVRNAAKEPVFIQTWKDKNATTATALRTEQLAMRFIFIIVVVISTFPILAAMIMLVKNKSKDIAILRTIGASRASIMRIFFIAGATVGVLGTLTGLVLGILLCLNIDGVQSIIEAISGRPLFPPDVYSISGGIPAKVVWPEVLGVAICGFAVSAVATFFPALNASRIDPVEALRYE